MTPKETLEELKLRANQPYSQETIDLISKWKSAPVHEPRAAILSCADARISPEHLLPYRPGELFTVRVAGNIVDSNGLASLEYAVNALNVDVLIVLGHEDCGAVKTACQFVQGESPALTPDLYRLLSNIFPAVIPGSMCSGTGTETEDGPGPCEGSHLREKILANLRQSVETIIDQGMFCDRHAGTGNPRELWVCPGYVYFERGRPHVEWFAEIQIIPRRWGDNREMEETTGN